MNLAGKIAVVTGANRGIGLELARQLAARDAHVIAACRRPAVARELQALAAGGRVEVSQLEDAADAEAVGRWAADLKGKNKIDRVDLLINNAGVLVWQGLEATTKADMLRMFETNAIGPLLCTQALLREGLLKRGAVVAHMSSKVGSLDDNGMGGGYAYRASKAALNMVGRSMSIDLKPQGITVVLLHPGAVRTDMTGGGGLIDAHESAAGLLEVLTTRSAEELNGGFFEYKNLKVKW